MYETYNTQYNTILFTAYNNTKTNKSKGATKKKFLLGTPYYYTLLLCSSWEVILGTRAEQCSEAKLKILTNYGKSIKKSWINPKFRSYQKRKYITQKSQSKHYFIIK